MKTHTFLTLLPTSIKTLGKLSLMALIGFGALSQTSCVAKKKYDAEVSGRTKAEADARALAQARATLESDTAVLAQRNRDMAANLNSQALSANAEQQLLAGKLQGKERELAEQQRRLRELQATLNRQTQAVQALRTAVASALQGFKTDELTIENKNGKVYVSLQDKLLFPSGSTQVNPAGKDALKRLAEVLSKNSDIEIVVEGHTDNVPVKPGASFKDNWDLSVLRATTISRLMIDNGIDAKRIEAAGRGEYFPVASNADAAGKARNRRTEIILSPKLDELYRALEGGMGN